MAKRKKRTKKSVDEDISDDRYSDTGVPHSYSVLSWVMTIPLCDDLWLSMQAQNIATIELAVIRNWELDTARKLFAEDRTPSLDMMALNAISQMWLFSLYEFLRTWRERAKVILDRATQYEKTAPRKRVTFLEKTIAEAREKEKYSRALTYYANHISQISDPAFVKAVEAYWDKTDGLFEHISELRMTLAKHQVRGSKFFAEAPGYARMDLVTGTLYWPFTNSDGHYDKLDRRKVADLFLDIKPQFTDEDRYDPEPQQRA